MRRRQADLHEGAPGLQLHRVSEDTGDGPVPPVSAQHAPAQPLHVGCGCGQGHGRVQQRGRGRARAVRIGAQAPQQTDRCRCNQASARNAADAMRHSCAPEARVCVNRSVGVDSPRQRRGQQVQHIRVCDCQRVCLPRRALCKCLFPFFYLTIHTAATAGWRVRRRALPSGSRRICTSTDWPCTPMQSDCRTHRDAPD